MMVLGSNYWLGVIQMDKNIPNNTGVETCVCCGKIIPEGRQMCPSCENDTKLMEVDYGRSNS